MVPATVDIDAVAPILISSYLSEVSRVDTHRVLADHPPERILYDCCGVLRCIIPIGIVQHDNNHLLVSPTQVPDRNKMPNMRTVESTGEQSGFIG